MFDVGPPPKLWLPPKPAIIRPGKELVKANFLPGMSPGFIALAPDLGILSLHSATSNFLSSTIDVPATVVAGDLLVLYDMGASNVVTAPTDVTPTGFTQIGTVTDTGGGVRGYRCNLSYKLAVGGEASSTLTGLNSSTEHKVLFVFRGSRVITAVSVSDYEGFAGTGTPTAQVVAASAGTKPLVVIAGYSDADNSGGSVGTRGMIPAKDAE